MTIFLFFNDIHKNVFKINKCYGPSIFLVFKTITIMLAFEQFITSKIEKIEEFYTVKQFVDFKNND